MKLSRELADRIERAYGALDVLINNAGISLIAPAEETSAEQWQRVMAVNLLGPFLLCNRATLTVDGGWIADASWESLRLRTRA